MPYKNPEEARLKAKARREALRAAAPKKLCACGCGTFIPAHNGYGKPLLYARWHKPSLPKGHVAKRVLEAPLVVCGCGCGELLPDRNRHGNKQRYIYGHTPNKRWPTEEPPLSLRAHSSSPAAIRSRTLKWSRKVAVFRHYSGGDPKCACCEEPNLVFLVIDHIEGAGTSTENRHGLVEVTVFTSGSSEKASRKASECFVTTATWRRGPSGIALTKDQSAARPPPPRSPRPSASERCI